MEFVSSKNLLPFYGSVYFILSRFYSLDLQVYVYINLEEICIFYNISSLMYSSLQSSRFLTNGVNGMFNGAIMARMPAF